MLWNVPKAVGVGALCLAALSALPGCKFFDLGNPFLPKARVVAVPNPSMINVKATYASSTGVITVEATDPTIQVQSFPNDASPGITYTAYSGEYFDQVGNAISTIQLSKVNFGIAAYLPPASAGSVSQLATPLTLPIYNQQVQGFAIDQVFSFVPNPTLNRELIHTINCRVTLYGQDDNFNQIETQLAVPIRFEGAVTQ